MAREAVILDGMRGHSATTGQGGGGGGGGEGASQGEWKLVVEKQPK